MIAKYPLYQFDSDLTTPFEIVDGVSISFNDIDIEAIDPRSMSSEVEYLLSEPRYCLVIDENRHDRKLASTTFMLSSRLIKRSKVFIRYGVDSSNRFIKLRDDYPHVTSPDVATEISKLEFQSLSRVFTALDDFRAINNRTKNAVYFLMLACRSRNCLEALLFRVTALETLTSAPDRENGITEKFVDRICSFIKFNKDDLKEMYDFRSGLVHGRYECKSLENNRRLNCISDKVCRKVFSKILLECNYHKLFTDDNKRMALFGERQRE